MRKYVLLNDNDVTETGSIRSPGKHFILALTKEIMDTVNNRQISNSISLARRAIIECGIDKDFNSV